MRLFFAGIFILAGVLLACWLYVQARTSSNVTDIVFYASIALTIAAAYFLFKERSVWVKRGGVMTYRHQERLVPESFHAGRALELRDPDLGDGWYLIELDSGKVLCLWDNLPSGRLGTNPTNPSANLFPCAEFTIFRDRKNGTIGRVENSGIPIRPVRFDLPDQYMDWIYEIIGKEGEVLPGKTFDQVQKKIEETAEAQRSA